MSPAQLFTYRYWCRTLLLLCGLLPAVQTVQAVTLVSQTFTSAITWGAASGWYRGGSYSPNITSANGTTNWLRLIDNSGNAQGYVYYNTAFNSNQGFVIDFEFASFGGSGADGISMFLFDGATATFRSGAAGGSLSYANDCAAVTPAASRAGLSKAYIGIAFDEFGNFANQNDRCKNGGVGAALPDSVSIRGAGDYDGTTTPVPTTVYPYLTSASSATSLDCTGCSTRPESGTNWRHARVTMLQSGSTWTVSVDIQFGTGSAFTRLINAYTLPNPPFATLKLGFAASSGGSTNYHDIRNVMITNPVDTQITKTVSATDIMVGGAFSYTLGVSNTNITSAANVVVTDTLPIGKVAYTSYSISPAGGSCTFATPTLTCALGAMATNSAKTITVNATGQTQSVATNTAVVTQDDIDVNPNNNTASVSHNVWSPPSLTVVKSANGSSATSTINPGGTLLYTITTTNSGAGPSITNVLTDSMSPFTALDLTYNSAQVFQLIQGSTTSGLSLGTPVYSNDNGLTWTYTPVSGGGGAPAGFDGAVTNFRIPMTGSMSGGGASYTVRYNTRVE